MDHSRAGYCFDFREELLRRYLCPYGGFLGLVSLLSPMRITRNSNTCIDCAKCAKACPSALPVDQLLQIRSAECTGCLECVAVCPAKDTLTMSVPLGMRKPLAKVRSNWSAQLVREFANPSAGTPRVLRQKEVHIIADAVAKCMADFPHMV